ncbi:MAG TPA: hypothetical protein VGB27_07925, partial [Candidatus Binatia bacterium]
MKRRIMTSCWIAAGVIWLVPSANAQDKVRMGLSSVSALHSATWVAEQKGFYRKHGIDAEI